MLVSKETRELDEALANSEVIRKMAYEVSQVFFRADVDSPQFMIAADAEYTVRTGLKAHRLGAVRDAIKTWLV